MNAEDRLQISVAGYLDLALPAGAVYFHIPNGGSRHVREAAKLKRMGVKAGIPDLCIIWRRRAIFIELKRAADPIRKTRAGRLSDEQTAMAQALTLAGAVVTVCRSRDEVADFLGCLMPMRGRVMASSRAITTATPC